MYLLSVVQCVRECLENGSLSNREISIRTQYPRTTRHEKKYQHYIDARGNVLPTPHRNHKSLCKSNLIRDFSVLLMETWYPNYTMHNKFSNCFIWVSQSTSYLKFQIEVPNIWQEFPFKNTKLQNAAAVLKCHQILRLAGNVGISGHLGKLKAFSSDCLVTENQKNIANAAIFWTFSEK